MRLWEMETIQVGDRRVKTYVIRCATPSCEEVGVGGGLIGRFSAHDALPKVFGQKGWTVGTSAKHDRCPKCSRKRAGRPPAERKVIPMTQATGFLAGPSSSPKSPPSTHIHAPQPPDVMSREDRRVVFAKLQEVYISEEVGYDDGWDDQKVATDLGVPVAWVADVREPNFGPNKSQAVGKLHDEGQAVLAHINNLLTTAQTLHKDFQATMAELSKATIKIDKFDRDLKELAKRR